MERFINHAHEPPCFDEDIVFLTLSCGSSSSSSSSEATPATSTPLALAHQAPPERVLLRGRRHRRGQPAAASFDCRTCGREFLTFQALGGHRTSHLRRPATTKKKTRSSKVVLVHSCAACGLGFSTGQALGGHMRRHRNGPGPTTISTTEQEKEGCGGLNHDVFAVDITRAFMLHGRPSSARLQLLDLFV